MFYSYLGDRVSTPLAFINPHFSDEYCRDIVTLKKDDVVNGFFVIDSVCGLDGMSYPKSKFKFNMIKILPNPAQDVINLEVEAPFETAATVSIYNLYGEIVKIIYQDKLKEGFNKLSGEISSLNPGMYYIELNSGIYKKTLNLMISR
jgi:hypothetical protein